MSLNEKDYEIMQEACTEFADDFWGPNGDESNIFLLEDIEGALEQAGYELVLQKKSNSRVKHSL